MTLRRRLAAGLLLLGLLALLAPSPATARTEASAFPLFHAHEGPTTGTGTVWAPWPFVQITHTTDTLTYGLHPLFSWFENREAQTSDLHILWPLVRRTFRPSTFKGEDWRVFYVFPLLYFGRGLREGESIIARYILPVYYQGREGEGRKHLIVFPFLWYARDARLVWPLFPRRPQTFAALWPLFGDFRGYWNRDRITFVFWPLFVRSRKGRGDDAVHIHSFAWPFFSLYSGKGYSGFRAWPLFSTVAKEGEFRRTYWLWPLGHRRTGVAADGKTKENTTVFLPFYANKQHGDFQWNLLFPFYGRFQVGSRTARGYLLSAYHIEENTRTGIVERRLFWFLWRWRTLQSPPEDDLDRPARDPAPHIESTPAPPPPGTQAAAKESPAAPGGAADMDARANAEVPPVNDEAPDDEDVDFVGQGDNLQTGWALFPLYGRMTSPTRIRSFMAWPFYTHNWDRQREYEFDRRYLVPFYSSQTRRWNDGAISRSSFFFPFFKASLRRDGTQHRHWLHLWWYDSLDGIDRNYAPLWTFHEKDWNERTGESRIRVLKNLYEYDRRPDGWTRKAFRFLVFSTETTPERTDTSLLWGLFGYHRRNDESKVRLFWFLDL